MIWFQTLITVMRKGKWGNGVMNEEKLFYRVIGVESRTVRSRE
jgi:hypothetical protein